LRRFFRPRHGWLRQPLAERTFALLVSASQFLLLTRLRLPPSVRQKIPQSDRDRVKTVSTYRSRLLEQFDMHTHAEVMRYAIENGLVDS